MRDELPFVPSGFIGVYLLFHCSSLSFVSSAVQLFRLITLR